MTNKIYIGILLFTALTGIIFYLLYRKKKAELAEARRLYQAVHGLTRFADIMDVIVEELKAKGIDVLTYLMKKRKDHTLTNDDITIPITEYSSAVSAFFTQQPCSLNTRRLKGADKELFDKYGHVSFLPVNLGHGTPCWKTHGCNNKECKCRTLDARECWLVSDKAIPGGQMETYPDKAKRCMSCQSFSPVGVFIVRGGDISGKTRFVNETFSGILRASLLFENEAKRASLDALTGLANRRTLEAALISRYELAARYAHPLSVCMFDIDHFKQFNDTYGHQIGDVILRELATFVVSHVRKVDLVARYGGEEFTIVFPETDKNTARDVVEKIRREVESYGFAGDKKITISMGIASYPVDDSISAEDLVGKADKALYAAKENRNKVVTYSKKAEGLAKKKNNANGR